jgi:hypothetical protein
MGNPKYRKRNADGETIGGVHTANDARKTDSMVPAPGEDDASQPLPKRQKRRHPPQNNGRMNDTLGGSVISNESPECSQSLPGDTGLDKATQESITVQISTCIAEGAPSTESSATASDTESDASVDSQAQGMLKDSTEAPGISEFGHLPNMDRPSSRRTAEDIEKTSEIRDAVKTPPHSILALGLLRSQIEVPTPSSPRHEAPKSTQDFLDEWKKFFGKISQEEKTDDEGSDEKQVDAIALSCGDNTPVEEGGEKL